MIEREPIGLLMVGLNINALLEEFVNETDVGKVVPEPLWTAEVKTV